MPNEKCTHEYNRSKVCAPCGNKIKFSTQKVEFYKINTTREKLIQKFINYAFDSSNSKFPCSICNTCRNIIFEHENGCFKRPLPVMPNYKGIY